MRWLLPVLAKLSLLTKRIHGLPIAAPPWRSRGADLSPGHMLLMIAAYLAEGAAAPTAATPCAAPSALNSHQRASYQGRVLIRFVSPIFPLHSESDRCAALPQLS